MKYKIAFFTSDWNYEIINEFLEGTDRFLREYQDTQVYVFDNFGKRGSTDLDEGIFAFLKMPYLEDYDGIVIQGNQAWPGNRRQEIVDRARESGIPAVSINYKLKDATYIGTDNFEAQKAITAHVIREHHVRDLAFIRGFARSKEAQDRERAFLEACAENGISKEEVRLYDGSWQQVSGEVAAEKMLSEGKLPRAVICANDDLAAGAALVFVRHGVRIPEDVIITGFDNLDIASAFEPSISSVDRDYAMNAYIALKTLRDEILTGVHKTEVRSPFKLMTRGSCGCENQAIAAGQFKQLYYQTRQYMKNYYYSQEEMQANMLEATTIPAIMNVFEQYGHSFGKSNMSILINHDYLIHPEMAEQLSSYDGVMDVMAMIGNWNVKGRIAGQDYYGSCTTRELLPEQMKKDHRLLIFYPLHYQKICMGYIVMNGISAVAEYNFLEIFVMLLKESMESVRRQQILMKMNERLDDLYLRDNLTGLYNRFGLERYGFKNFQSMKAQNKRIRFSFVDIDHMKYLNDYYGHEAGDLSIIGTAERILAIQKYPNVLGFRYGGDEFLVISDADNQRSNEEINRLTEGFSFKNPGIGHRDIQVGLSVGSFVKAAEDDLSFEDCIHAADMKMYECKAVHHGRMNDFD